MSHSLNVHGSSFVNSKPSGALQHVPGRCPSVGKIFKWPWNFPYGTRHAKYRLLIRLSATKWHANSYQCCVHSTGQCSDTQSLKPRLCVRTRKIAQVYAGKRAVRKWQPSCAVLFGSTWSLIMTQPALSSPVGYFPHTARCLTVSHEIKTDSIWM